MTIATVQADRYSIPLPETLSDSTHGEMSHFELVTVRIRDQDGAEGLGYTYTVGAGAAAILNLIHDMKPLLIGAEAGRIEDLWQKMWWHLHYAGRGGPTSFAISAIDIALWDLKAKRAEQPLWRLLGGHDANVTAYAGGIDLFFPLEKLLAQTQGNLDKGFHAIKMKVGRDSLSEDLERVAAMRDFLGADFPLMVDANMRWRMDQAIRAAQALQEYRLVWLEEPTIPDDPMGHGRIAREGGVPIAAGENLHTLYEFRNLIAASGVDFPEPDVSNCGGITIWMKVAHLAEANNLPVTSHGVHDIHVHLLAAVPNKSYLEVHGFGLERFIANPMILNDTGHAVAPERPGHGVEFDWDGLSVYGP
ncbi:MAG: mandelate racemase/muconate lactonizing enzyme family protein [Rhodospirillaceae bacterium]|jgi:L-alanine-DL-glutamate epimerase-like enolase superfamily enzyme|nr:mandelate racemase/muconate lactonizing enzyme family protein [Rhodospirillaceae bacterium]MBT5191567.1 mandelate racemase/muconate lactonizing enzyme family protein [Rhodospirillaceae bacterium]MBT5894594.1 mandelate racemase/muconate lactonizing enzyme family protein [Rhodospirillaceae bacterium]